MLLCVLPFFFFNDTATTEIYTLSLHDALPISLRAARREHTGLDGRADHRDGDHCQRERGRSEEHTSELQSQSNLVCRLLLEKKKCWPKSCSAGKGPNWQWPSMRPPSSRALQSS